MHALAAKKSEAFHAAFLGTETPVLFETEREGVTDGLTANYIRVYTDAPVRTGEIHTVRLVRLHRDGVWGELQHG